MVKIYTGLCACLLVLPLVARGDDTDAKCSGLFTCLTEFSLGVSNTELDKSALNLLFEHIPALKFGETLAGGVYFNGYELGIKQGGEDALDGIIAKAQGVKAYTGDIARQSTIYAVPFSAGIESDRDGDNIALIGEIGVVPLIPQRVVPLLVSSESAPHYGFGKNRAGLFVQFGYKAAADREQDEGGAKSVSEEGENDAIARLKLDIRHSFESGAIGFEPHLKTWYDMLNGRVYYNAKAVVRFSLQDSVFASALGRSSIDFVYEKGSGAPNFNEGEQISANLTVAF